MRTWIREHRGWSAALIVGAAAILGAGVYWFAPQNLLVDERVDETLPVAASSPSDGSSGPAPASEPGPSGSRTLASGQFRGLEHETSGRALLVELADGRRFLRFEDLSTSNGPDLRVYLSDQPISDDWHVWDDGTYLDLGGLKGNLGSSNYRIGADVDLSRFRTAVVWCRRFTVGFGVAPLDPGR